MHGRSFIAVIATAVPALAFAASVQVEAYAEDAATEQKALAPPLPDKSPAKPRVIVVPTVEVPAPVVAPPREAKRKPAPSTAGASTLGPAEPSAPGSEATAATQTDPPASDAGPAPAPVPAGPVVEKIRAKLAAPALAGMTTPEDLAALQAFYAERSEPVWITPMGFTAKAQDAIDEIAEAEDWGLSAAAFNLPPAGDLTDEADEQADAEIKLAIVILKYARHARGGRADPSSVSKLLDQQPPLKDPKTVLAEIAASDEPDVYLRGLHPKHEQFHRLRQALIKARGQGEGNEKKASERDIRRILINMERWRWMPEDLGSFYVQDNIPEFMLYVVKDGKTIHSDKIVVGKLRYATPIFSADMRTIVFNPEWTVPPTIVREDLLPKLRGGGGWFSGGSSVLRQHGLKVKYNGRVVDPGSINWSSVNLANVAFVQAPGPTNVLGKLKFLYPNKHIVYMHDTIKPNLFKTAIRAEGHNCIRMEKPAKLAEILLAHDKGWDTKKIQELLAKGYDAGVSLDKPFPVHTTYFTAVVDESGAVKTFGDVYGLDSKVAAAVFGKSVSFATPEVTSSVPQPEAAAAAQPKPKKKEATADSPMAR